MKFKIMFKDPDGVSECLEHEAKDYAETVPSINKAERERIAELRYETLKLAIRPWVEYGEYLEVEFDTDAKTATVVPVK